MAHRIEEPLYTISAVAKRTGLSAEVLRMWELRYGWPRPRRSANRYRRYPECVVRILEQVHEELDRGRAIGELMRDPWWQVVFASNQLPAAKPKLSTPAGWTTIPQPHSRLGREVRAKLEQALVASDTRLARWAQAVGQQLHPTERDTAVRAVLRCWHQAPTSEPS